MNDVHGGERGTAGKDTAPVELLMPEEVAGLFLVEENAVWRWGSEGRLPFIRTPAGHRRYLAAAVHALLADVQGGDAGTS